MEQGGSEISMGARVAAVVALVTAAIALILALGSVLAGGNGEGTPAGSANGASVAGGKSVPATYRIEEGDTLSGISAQTGVSVTRIEELNPGLDPQAITPGQEIRLR